MEDAGRLSPNTERRHELELRKLELERERLDLEVEKARRGDPWWTRLGGMLAPVATLSALASLSFTMWSTSKQREIERERRRADEFHAAVQDLVGDERATKRVAALRRLGQYWPESTYRAILRRYVLDQLVSDPDERVRRELQEELLEAGVDSALLDALAQQNRQLQSALVAAGGRITQAYETVGGEHTDTIAVARPALAVALRDLGWNVRTLIAAVNKAGQVGRVSFRNVSFTRLVYLPSTPPRLITGDTVRFRQDLEFEGTQFQGANISGITFRGAKFTDVTFDSATMAGTQIVASIIEGGSLREIRTSLGLVSRDNLAERGTGMLSEALHVQPVAFVQTTARVHDLYVRPPSRLVVEDSRFTLSDTSESSQGDRRNPLPRLRPMQGSMQQ